MLKDNKPLNSPDRQQDNPPSHKTTPLPLDKLGKAEALELIRQWLDNPVSQTFLSELRKAATLTKAAVLYDDPPGMSDPKFLLREQLIGEARGLERLDDIVARKVEELRKETVDTDKPNSNTLYSVYPDNAENINNPI
jgi:hypothetical protein